MSPGTLLTCLLPLCLGATSVTQQSTVALTLEAALLEANRANPALLRARNERASAAVDRREAYSGYLPRLDLNASFGRNYVGSQRQVRVVPVLDSSSTPPTMTYDQQEVWTPERNFADYALGASLEQPLFDGFQTTYTVAQARAAERAATKAVDEEALAIAFEVTRRFFEVVRAQRNLEVLNDTVRQSAQVVERAEALYAAGRTGKGDVLAAKVNYGSDQIHVATQLAALAQARADLAVLLGRDADPALQVVIPDSLSGVLPPTLTPPPTDELLALARRSRPALLRYAELAQAAQYGVKSATAAFWPSVGVQLGYTRQSPNLSGAAGVYGPLAHQHVSTAGLFVRWNLFDAGHTSAARQRATLAQEHALLTADEAEQQLSAEINRARSDLVAQDQSCRLAIANVAVAEQGVALAEDRLSKGAATQLEVRDAVFKLTQSRLTYVSARIDLALALADLNRAVGGVLSEKLP